MSDDIGILCGNRIAITQNTGIHRIIGMGYPVGICHCCAYRIAVAHNAGIRTSYRTVSIAHYISV